ncbi:acyl-CoA dehydrogenase family protein [Rhodococcus rhodochrous]|uniref:acyl-CoA dehydrogenase family protein n=1 Tax=Rhodococcus rhodochrous TaxID=1829 RepID=UPI001E589C91|nr:acyl-CoA dehydrogenase family protein [Rhodococcus rhodochrous]MCQ4138076.1 acyl-CoA/acyl-ACP dehydrogenase [Rhodococcus rhodochrous]
MEQSQLRDEVREFAANTLRPAARDCDRAGTYLPAELMREINRRYGRIGVPREFGGLGLDPVSLGLVVEELAYADLGASDLLGGNILGLSPVLMFGSETLRLRFAEILRADREHGAVFLALAGTEPASGSDVLSASRTGGSLHTAAVKVPGGWRISGHKKFISNGPIATYIVTLCATDLGPTLFVVPSAATGFRVGVHSVKLGHRTTPTSELHFDDVFVPDNHLVGAIGQGAHIFDTALSLARPGVAIASAGAARCAYDIALNYCVQRTQGGQALIEHQAVQARLAALTIRVEAARAMAMNAFIQTEDIDAPRADMAIMAKVFCSDIAAEVVDEAMQLLGGNGYMAEYGIEKLYRDIKLNRIYEGENNYLAILLGRSLARTATAHDSRPV